jgi:hypothetical protein
MIPFLTTLLIAPAAGAQLLLNQATADQLSSLDGVEAHEAAQIVQLRSERSRLSSVEELRVLNLDPRTLGVLRNNLSVEFRLVKVAGTAKFSSVDEVLAHFAGEPDVGAVQAMAMSYTKTNPELVEGWLKASRTAFGLPAVTLSYDKDLDDYNTWNYLDLDGNGSVETDEFQLYNSRADDDDSFGVRLAWRLDKIVMSSERIRVINEAQDIVKLRDKILEDVTRLYFDRRRLQVEQVLSPPGDLRTQLKNELRLQELTANIDALTGGRFSAELSR